MRTARAVGAELRKAATLPATLIGCGIMLLSMLALTVLNALATDGAEATESAFDVAFYGAPIGVVGAVVVGVVLVSSEYTANSPDSGGGRQITTTLIATSSRVRLLVAKALAMVVFVVPTAAVTSIACVGVATAVRGDAAGAAIALDDALRRAIAVVAYWILIALMALAVTVLTRSGVIPLVFFIVNSAVLPPFFLLSRVTDLAFWLPDTSGIAMVSYGIGQPAAEGALGIIPGALVMTTWALGLLAVAALVLHRRDA